MRLFVALRLEPELQQAVTAFQTRLRRLDSGAQVRWVEPQGMHLTLKFLGEVEPERLPALQAGLDTAISGRTAPVLSLSLPGGFPNLRRPRVLWIGLVEEGTHVLELQAAVEAEAARLGWEAEKRAFQPHLTLGRLKDIRGGASAEPPRQLVEAMSETSLSRAASITHPRVAIMQSHLSPSGARYEDIHSWRLICGGSA